MAEPAPADAPPPRPARRRYLTILFSDLSDSTRLGAAMEAEHYAEMLARLRQAYQDVIQRHGGTIVRIQGDGVLAIFGYPETRDDDTRRAAEAALDLHQAARGLRFDPPLPGNGALGLHTGIHSGLVLLDAGDVVRGRFELLGTAPNIALRLSDAAERDQILVSDETLGPDRQFFAIDERHYLGLKGRAEPIAVHRILGRAARPGRFDAQGPRGRARFVGRAAELQMLGDSLQSANAGRAQHLVLCAAPGVGKTRLVEEFLLRHAASVDCRILRGHCEAGLDAEPLQPFLQMARELFELEQGVAPAQAAAALDQVLATIDPALQSRHAGLMQALSFEAPPTGGAPLRSAQADTRSALHDLFAALAATRPLLLFIDDWQWADDASRQMLQALRGQAALPLLLIVSTSCLAAGNADGAATRMLSLPPLGEDEASLAIAQLLPQADPLVATEIRRHAGGNPLFIEELCHSVGAEADMLQLAQGPVGESWLYTCIESRLARLPPEQAQLVRAAAVVGCLIPLWLLERLTGCGEDHPLLRELAEQDFLFPAERPGCLRFKHRLARDAVYAGIDPDERCAMHLAAAQALRRRATTPAGEDLYETLAHHYAGAGEAAEGARYAELAGDKAAAVSALDRARAQYRAALAALDRLPAALFDAQRWSSIAQRLALASVFSPSRGELDLFRRAVALAAEHGDAALAKAEHGLACVHHALGDSREAIHHAERALAAALRTNDKLLTVQIRTVLGQAHTAAGDYDTAFALLDQAIAIKRQHRSGARPAVGSSYSLVCKAYILGDRGLFAQADACFEEALEAVRGANHEVESSIRVWRSCVHLWQGRWIEAQQSADEARTIAGRLTSRYLFAMSHALSGYARWMLEQGPEPLQAVKDATSWLEAGEGALLISLNYGWLTDSLVSSGQFLEARQLAARGLQRARRSDRAGEAMTYRALARAAAAEHRPAAARRYLDLALLSARRRRSPHEKAVTQLCDAEIALTLDRRGRAAGLLHEAGAAFDTLRMHWHRDAALRLLRACG